MWPTMKLILPVLARIAGQQDFQMRNAKASVRLWDQALPIPFATCTPILQRPIPGGLTGHRHDRGISVGVSTMSASRTPSSLALNQPLSILRFTALTIARSALFSSDPREDERDPRAALCSCPRTQLQGQVVAPTRDPISPVYESRIHRRVSARRGIVAGEIPVTT